LIGRAPMPILPLVIMFGVMFIDGYDLNAMSLAVPYLLEETGLSRTDFSLVFSADLVGLGAGALLLAPLGDRIGRRFMIVATCIGIAIATFGTASASGISGFAIWRFFTGLALGGCLPNISAFSAELAPDTRRAFTMASVSAGIAIGALTAGLTAPELNAIGGWRLLFYVPAALALLLAVALFFVLPGERLKKDVALVETRSRVPLLDLFRPPYVLAFVIFAGIYLVNALALYMLVRWIPSFLPDAGFSSDYAVRVTGLMQGAALPIGIGLSFLIDRWRPGLTFLIAYFCVAGCFLALYLLPPGPLSWGVFLLLAGGGLAGANSSLMTLTSYLFPSRMLSSAIGLGVAIARGGAIAGPPIGGMLIENGATPAQYFAWMALPMAICGVLSLLIPLALSTRTSDAVRV